MRYDSQPDSLTVHDTIGSLDPSVPDDNDVSYYACYKEMPWSSRRIGIANQVQFACPDVLCVQEAKERQVNDLNELLKDEYDWEGVGRDDGLKKGEFEAIFYRKDKFRVLHAETFWLSHTPFVPSKYPGAGSVRSATVVRFIGELEFSVINCHLDEQSESQRRLAVSLLLYRASYEFDYYSSNNKPGLIFLLGDFNSQSSGDSAGAYDIITAKRKPETIDSDFAERYANSFGEFFHFEDLLAATPPQNRSGNHATFTGFQEKAQTRKYTRIDFQFGGETSKRDWDALRFKTEENFYDNEYPLSDHRAIVCDVGIL